MPGRRETGALGQPLGKVLWGPSQKPTRNCHVAQRPHCQVRRLRKELTSGPWGAVSSPPSPAIHDGQDVEMLNGWRKRGEHGAPRPRERRTSRPAGGPPVSPEDTVLAPRSTHAARGSAMVKATDAKPGGGGRGLRAGGRGAQPVGIGAQCSVAEGPQGAAHGQQA